MYRRSLPSRSLAEHTADELEFDAHGRAPLGLSGGCMMQAILPEFVAYPQLLHALRSAQLEIFV